MHRLIVLLFALSLTGIARAQEDPTNFFRRFAKSLRDADTAAFIAAHPSYSDDRVARAGTTLPPDTEGPAAHRAGLVEAFRALRLIGGSRLDSLQAFYIQIPADWKTSGAVRGTLYLFGSKGNGFQIANLYARWHKGAWQILSAFNPFSAATPEALAGKPRWPLAAEQSPSLGK
ncbi:hypothetical protein [Flaviaesturariibacter amylovorans]|uniref:Nuclear transport factor 2 family protein n=1 Tax=Flaviaesturariibacter amylovorans TaxID=1084520 RepID=A0ABP8HT80_9BACT